MSHKPEITKRGTDVWGAVLKDLRDTIVGDGGHTWSPYREAPTSGYMVSLAGQEERIALGTFVVLGEVFIQDYVEAHEIDPDASLFYGAWVDNGWVVLDVSEHFHREDDAIEAGWDRGQDAIYDLDSQMEIRRPVPESVREAAHDPFRDIPYDL